MYKNIIFLFILFINLSRSAQALNDIDKGFVQNGVTACNGESPNCNTFLLQNTLLNDERTPISPERRF